MPSLPLGTSGTYVNVDVNRESRKCAASGDRARARAGADRPFQAPADTDLIVDVGDTDVDVDDRLCDQADLGRGVDVIDTRGATLERGGDRAPLALKPRRPRGS